MDNLPNKLPKNKTICLPFDEKNYYRLVRNVPEFRAYLDRMREAFPELLPAEITHGYRMKDNRRSSKLGLTIRRIKIGKENYSIRPSFAMPYMVGKSDDVEKPLFLRKFAVPFWALSHVFGRNAMYWYRMYRSLGRNSLVGTTVNEPEKLPEDLCSDEKHSWRKGERIYVATTVGSECFLGVDIAQTDDAPALTQAYGRFKQEAQLLKPGYSPKTINTDGWEATRNAWLALFPGVSIILCILHIFIAIRDRSKKKYKEIFALVADKFWHAYEATGRQFFSQRVRRLYEWAVAQELPAVIVDKLAKLHYYLDSYARAYYFPRAHRTSNMLDRLMRLLDRVLFSMQYFHRSGKSANLNVRAWSLIYNFAPWNPATVEQRQFKSPAHMLNGSYYHENWLQNLLISASLGGYRTPPQNPLQ